MKKFLMSLMIVLFLAAGAQAQTPFYQGKTISYHRRHQSRRCLRSIPPDAGRVHGPNIFRAIPNIIIQNVPGAASMIAANQLYNVTQARWADDRRHLSGALLRATHSRNPKSKFDWTKIRLGSAITVTSNHLMYMRADTPYKTIEDVRKASTAPKCRRFRSNIHRLLHAQANGRNDWHQV